MYHNLVSNLNGTTDPTGTVTPDYTGQMYVNTTTKEIYVSKGTTNTDWIYVNPRGITEFHGLGSSAVYSDAQITNNTTTNITYLTMNYPNVFRLGSVHRLEAHIDFSCDWGMHRDSNEAIFELYEGTTMLRSWPVRYYGNSNSVYPTHLWYRIEDLSTATHTYSLRFRSSDAGKNVSIHRAELGISLFE